MIPANHDIRLTYLDVLYSYYEQVINFTQDNNIDCDLTFKEFHDLYYENNMNLNEFVEGCINYLVAASLNSNFLNEEDLMNFEFTPTSSSSSGNQKWYYNIDDRGILKKPTYNNSVYNLLGSYIYNGDLLYEAAGFFGLTGHMAMVQGVFYSTEHGSYYRRVIESVHPGGVCHGVLDDVRFVERKGYLLWVPSATQTQRNDAVNFCESQFRKPYVLDLAKNTSPSEKDWYCSELVWAAYYNQGIDIEVRGFLGTRGDRGVTPHDIVNCALVSEYRSYKDK